MLAAAKYIPGLGKRFKVQTAEIEDDAITAAQLAAAPAIGDLAPGHVVEYVFDIPDAVTANYDFVLTHKTRVTDVMVISNGANGANANTIQVCKGTVATPITDAISMNGKAADALSRAATITQANWEVAAAGVLRIISTKAGGVAAQRVVVRGTIVA